MTFIFAALILITSLPLLAARTPEERKELFQGATQRLKESKIEKRVPRKGEIFPNLTLDDKKVSEWLKEGPLVITFYQ
jgi:hypothetical protein